MFDSIAPEYDKLNHIMSLDIDKTWRKRALKYIFKPDRAERAISRLRLRGKCSAGRLPARVKRGLALMKTLLGIR